VENLAELLTTEYSVATVSSSHHPGGIWSHDMNSYDHWKTTDFDGERRAEAGE